MSIDNTNYRETSLSQSLRSALASVPHNTVYKGAYCPLVFRILYFALSGESKFNDDLFLNCDLSNFNGAFPRSWDEVLSSTFDEGGVSPSDRFYSCQKSRKSKSHVGRICANEIPAGKLVYNCYDCGVDATCCLCDDCFNKEEHSDHNVSVHTSNGGAICDCGDETSWKNDLCCNAVESEADYLKTIPALNDDFKTVIRIVIRTVFDYIIDTTVTNIQTIPHINDLLHSEYTDINKFKTLSDASTLDSKYYNFPDSNSEIYHLLVWNDEFHNFDEAISLLKAGSKFNSSNNFYPEVDQNGKQTSGVNLRTPFLEAQAKYIDEFGVSSLCQEGPSNYHHLLLAMKEMSFLSDEKKGLTTTIVSERDWVKLCVSRYILNWLETILLNNNWKVVDCIQKELSQCLLDTAYISHDYHLTYSETPSLTMLNYNFQLPMFEGLSLQKCFPNESYIELSKLNFSHITNPNTQTENIKYQDSASRLQYIMFLEMRFPKKIRKLLKKIVIPIITNTTATRLDYAQQIMNILPVLEYLNSKYDREFDLTLLEPFRLQVYHDPNIGTQLLRNNTLENALSSCLAILSDSIRFGRYHISNSHEKWESKRRVKVTSQVLEGFKTILMFIHSGSDEMFYQSFFLKLIIWFSAFDELYKLVRKEGDHVEYQERDLCNMYHSAAYRMFDATVLMGKFAYGFEQRNHHLEESITILSSYLKLKPRSYNDSKTLVNFNVTTDGVTMIHPLTGLLGELIKGYKYFNVDLINNSVVHVHLLNGCVTFSPEHETFLGVSDEALQPLVYEAQITSNYWIRNGVDVRLASYFFNYYYNPENFITVIQAGILTKELSLENIMDRFMFTNCYENGEDFGKSVYEERSSGILSDVVLFFYKLFTFRTPFDSEMTFEKFTHLKLEIELASTIGMKPLQYSSIKNEFNGVEELDDILKSVAEYVPPQSYNDYGSYKLKSSYLEKFDPFDVLNNRNAPESVEESLLEQLAIEKNKKMDDMVLTPRLHKLSRENFMEFKPISDFMKSAKLVKFLYKALGFAINTDNDSHLNATLQLIHAIILDEKIPNYDDKDIAANSLNNFINIPICNLLLGVVEKEGIPKFIAKKASTILELLLLEDDSIMESLIACFGEARIDEYKKSKHGKTLETKMERTKRLALKRQKKVMKKMMKQQSDFVNKHSNYFEEETNKNGNADDSKISAHEHKLPNSEDFRTCILCKKPEDNSEIFGIPGSVSTSAIFWQIPTIANRPPKLMCETLSDYPGAPSKIGFPANCVIEKAVITGCPHTMHYKCFLTMLREKQQKHDNFKCPLCEGIFNVFIPSMRMRNFEIDPSSFNEQVTYDKLLKPDCGLNSSPTLVFTKDLVHQLNDPTSEPYVTIMKELMEICLNNISLYVSAPHYVIGLHSEEEWRSMFQNGKFLTFGISNIIGNSLEAFEIANRGLNEVSLKIPEIHLRLFRSLFQFRTLMNYSDKYQLDEDKMNYYETYLLDPHMGFVQTIMILFLEGGESLEDIFRIATIKTITTTTLAVTQRYIYNQQNLQLEPLLNKKFQDPVEPHSNGTLSKAGFGLSKLLNYAFVNNDAEFKDNIDITCLLYRLLHTNFENCKRQIALVQQLLNAFEMDEKSVTPNLDHLLEEMISEQSNAFNFFTNFFESMNAMGSPYLDDDDDAHLTRNMNGTANIPYPNKVKLIKLPAKLKGLVNLHAKKSKRNQHELICLNCGDNLNGNISAANHVTDCKMNRFSVLIFNPMKNNLKIYFTKMAFIDNAAIESPYLNKHGEPSQGIIGLGDSGTLDAKRYEHLQQIFFDQTLVRSLVRRIGGIDRLIRRSMNNNGGVIDTLHFPGIREPNGINISMTTPREFFINNFVNDGRIDPRVTQMLRDNDWLFTGNEDDDDDEIRETDDEDAGDGPWMMAIDDDEDVDGDDNDFEFYNGDDVDNVDDVDEVDDMFGTNGSDDDDEDEDDEDHFTTPPEFVIMEGTNGNDDGVIDENEIEEGNIRTFSIPNRTRGFFNRHADEGDHENDGDGYEESGYVEVDYESQRSSPGVSPHVPSEQTPQSRESSEQNE